MKLVRKLSSTELSRAKEIFTEIVGQATEAVNKFAEFNPIYSEQRWAILKLKESGASGENGHSIPYEIIVEILREILDREPSMIEELQSFDLFSKGAYEIMGISGFGFFFMQYFFAVTETTDHRSMPYPLQFNDDLFEKSWKCILPWISNQKIAFRLYYIIFDVTPVNSTSLTDHQFPRLIVADLENKNELLRRMKVYSNSFFFDPMITIDRVQWVGSIQAWIEGRVEITPDEITHFRWGEFGKHSLLEPTAIEESLRFLGHWANVRCLSIPELDYYHSHIRYHHKTGYFSPGRGSLPDELKFRVTSRSRNKFEVTDDIFRFILQFGEMRRSIDTQSPERYALDRFVRSFYGGDFNDCVLDTFIGLECLFVEGERKPGPQLQKKIAALIAQTSADQDCIERIVDLLYTIRCKIVHEGARTHNRDSAPSKYSNTITKLGGQTNAHKILRRIQQLCFFRLVQSQKDNLRFGRKDVFLRHIEEDNVESIPKNVFFDKLYVDAKDEFDQVQISP